jgi:class 3 adenylate cyclase
VASPPTGTITFLFTDIEGSTKLWEDNAPAMQAALIRHDKLLRWAIGEEGGYVFKTVGDAFCCAFPTAPDALEAALETQRRLISAEWELTWPLEVRMALHTGAAEERDGDYFGPPVNRVASSFPQPTVGRCCSRSLLRSWYAISCQRGRLSGT